MSASKAFVRFMKDSPKAVGDQYFRFEAEPDADKIVDSLSMAERIYPGQVLMLCNRSHPNLQYISINCENVFGMNAREFSELTVQQFFGRVHPDDVDAVGLCFDFINDAEPYDPISHRFVMHYRFKNSKNEYVHIRDEKLAVETSTGKYLYFTIFRNVGAQEKFLHVKLDVHQYKKGNDIKVYSYNPRMADESISPRQNEIMQLLIKGFSTQEIAENLNISVNTIRNHKQVLFRKVNVKSSVELISFARLN